jgi:exopolyphosphatase/guanosine-5'-triphosphate,3'-diphosphate pyrophosphatase
MEKYASIDIGSQTIRLLICERNPDGKISPFLRDQTIVRLGEKIHREKRLQETAIQRALGCIKKFIDKAKNHGASVILAIATACVREAENGQQFLAKVYQETGIYPRLLSGEEEAALASRGVQSVFHWSEAPTLIIDIGGGSTELILIQRGNVSLSESLALGVITIAEEHLSNDPPISLELQTLRKEISSVLVSECRLLKQLSKDFQPPVSFVGTAGTVTTLAAMDLQLTSYEPDRINGHLLTREKIEHLYQTMIAMPSQERISLAGLEPGREIVILPGILILCTIMDLLTIDKLWVSDAGLLEGVILDAIKGKTGDAPPVFC